MYNIMFMLVYVLSGIDLTQCLFLDQSGKDIKLQHVCGIIFS